MCICNGLRQFVAQICPAPAEPELGKLYIERNIYWHELNCLGMEVEFDGPFNGTYAYVTMEQWGEVITHTYLEMPTYIADLMDCDDFAWLFRGIVVARYHLNTFGFAIGNTDMGRHGFCFFRAPGGVWLIEPNPKFGYGDFQVLQIGERGYYPDKVAM